MQAIFEVLCNKSVIFDVFFVQLMFDVSITFNNLGA